MRRGIKDAGFVVQDDILIGISLGWDHTAEHEWGIPGIRLETGTEDLDPRKHIGFDRYKIRVVPERLHLTETDKYVSLGTYRVHETEDGWPHRELCIQKPWRDEEPEDFVGAWNENSWGALATSEEGRAWLKELHKAFQEKDVVIFLTGRDNPFANGGLTIALDSRIPEEFRKKFVEAHEDQNRLDDRVQEIEKETQFKEKLEEAGCRWLALSPSWLTIKSTSRGAMESQYDVMYWLNPCDQQNNNFGWYTVEQLLEWANHTGPVLKGKAG